VNSPEMNEHRILVAGIGNIFLGDDAFGVEVTQRLLQQEWPAGVRVADFGIRNYDLAYAMLEPYAATILVDATQRGHPPGTLYLIEPDLDEISTTAAPLMEAHSMNPVSVLQLVQALGGRPQQLYVVGCEPAVLETEDGYIGLSAAVQAAVPEAVEMVKSLVEQLLQGEVIG
jgi:hydrogenase maturation protease